jgi:hypothetical protein
VFGSVSRIVCYHGLCFLFMRGSVHEEQVALHNSLVCLHESAPFISYQFIDHCHNSLLYH